MIQTSIGYLAAVNSTSREWSARLASSGTAINAEIMSVTVHKGTRGDELNVGTMYAPYFEATVRNYSGASLLGSVLTFDLGLDVSGTTEWATIATGTVISAKAQGVDLLLTLAGPISALGDQTIESASTAVTDVVTEIQTKLGTTVTCRDGITSLTGTLAAAMTGQTIRGALQSLAAFFGGYVTENAAGQIVIGGLSQTSTTAISPDTYQEEPELSTGTYEITGWRVFVNSETYYLEGTEPYMDTACQFMTQTQFNAIKAGVIGQIFRGGSLDQTLGNPLIEPWDVLTLSVSADAMPRLGAVTIIYDGGVSVRIESPVITDDEQPAQVVGPLSGQVAEAAAAADSAKTSAEEALEAAQEVNNHFYVDSAGLHVTLLESSPNTGQNILIDSDGMDIRDGTTVKAHFGETVQVGQTGQSHVEVDYHSLQLYDLEGTSYFFASDLRDENGDYEYEEEATTVAEDETVTVTFPIESVISLTLDGVAQTEGTDYTFNGTTVTFLSGELAGGEIVAIDYITQSPLAKAYTLGTRDTTTGDGVGPVSVAEGVAPVASGYASHAEGRFPRARGDASHAEGSEAIASGENSHAEGSATVASGYAAHAEGESTTAGASWSHAEGNHTIANARHSHAEGSLTTVYGHNGTFYGGGLYGHAEGRSTYVSGQAAHAQNLGTKATSRSQTALGEFNEEDTTGSEASRGTYAVIVGNGTDDNNRSNAFAIDWDGIPFFRNPSDTFGSIFDLIYPVGSVYMSVNSTDPGTLFGGSWQPIEDTFLLAAGTNHAAGSTGGSEDAVVPYHRHSVSI
ncbi:MAG: hypothetical protein IJ133_04370, partial [Clostridia bacterium]|nr:hypothetical protein [Clostridia bacterium]